MGSRRGAAAPHSAFRTITLVTSSIAAILFVPVPAYALEIGARLPTRYGEVIVVKNDGGVKNWTTYFPYGSICHTDLDLKT